MKNICEFVLLHCVYKKMNLYCYLFLVYVLQTEISIIDKCSIYFVKYFKIDKKSNITMTLFYIKLKHEIPGNMSYLLYRYIISIDCILKCMVDLSP